MAARIQLEDGSAVVRAINAGAIRSSCGGGAIEIPLPVPHYTDRTSPIASVGAEAIQYGFLPGRIQLEHRTALASSPVVRRAIEIARRIDDYALGITPVLCDWKRIEQGIGLCLRRRHH